MSSSDNARDINTLIATGDAYAPRRDPRELMAYTFGAALTAGALGAAVYASVSSIWNPTVIALTAGTAIAALYAALTPWTRLAREWQLSLYWLAVLAVTAAVYVFAVPTLGLLLILPMMALTYFFGRERVIVAGNLTLAVAAFTLPVITGEADDWAGSLIVTLPAIVAVALLSGVLAERFHAMRARERDRYKATIEALSTALTARDGYTGTHSQETLWFVSAVCDELALPPNAREYVADVALLHDIGKIGIPNEILHAPGKLDEQQWDVMKQHPVIGERIVATIPGLEEVARAIRHEHERWDGNGYPDRLRQHEIPLASRIVLACDAWHAMTSDRPYRAAMSFVEARTELSRNAGTQFDPQVIGALINVIDNRADKKTRPSDEFDEIAELLIQTA
ncbi:MAG: HD-GYP domain-containing protein [Actinobacteria bacterium]|nr:HD-GYP domain-containing protein [Actinomycetota bacterium]